MKHSITLSALLASTLLSALVAIGCTSPGGEEPKGPVCDPLSSNATTPADTSSATSGLKADLYAIPRPPSPVTTVASMMAAGTKINTPVYLNDINIPTQLFTHGFTAENNEPITDEYGTVISDYFALHIEGRLQLAAGDVPGPYQFAIYSDDGSVLYIDSGSGFKTIVDNDGKHNAILKVSSEKVILNVGDKLPIKIDYMQGEPDYLAFIVLMRPWPIDEATQPVNDPAVDDDRTNLFWDSSVYPSVAGPKWQELLSRGWKVAGPGNFALPEGAGTNPCATGSGN